MAHESHPDRSRWEMQRAERIVYDKANGEVVHVHQVMWPPDRKAPAESVIDADARHVAAKVAQRAEDTLDVLPVKLESLERNTGYAVDLRTKKLVKKAG
jgi:RecB family endonuclease NucS